MLAPQPADKGMAPICNQGTGTCHRHRRCMALYRRHACAGSGLDSAAGLGRTCEMFFNQIRSLGADIPAHGGEYPALSDPARLADGLARLMPRVSLEHASVLGSS